MKKKRIVLNDKEKIASVIKELDEKKNEALRNAWKKVNKVSGLSISLSQVVYCVTLKSLLARKHSIFQGSRMVSCDDFRAFSCLLCE